MSIDFNATWQGGPPISASQDDDGNIFARYPGGIYLIYGEGLGYINSDTDPDLDIEVCTINNALVPTGAK